MIVVKSSRKSLIKRYEELGNEYKDNELKRALPKTRFYGSKLRLIDWINYVVTPLDYTNVVDLFGGTSSTALLFKKLGKKVTYNDILEFNRQSAIALLSSENIYFNKKKVLNFSGSLEPRKGFITQTFKDIYYTNTENMWLDAAFEKVHRMRDMQSKADILYCIYQPCLQKRPFNLFHRKNLNLRLNCSRQTKFGNWSTWEKSFDELYLRSVGELLKAKSIQGRASVLPATDASEVKKGFDLVYIDPPYVSNTKNHLNYIGRYHFLEGFTLGHSWARSIDWNRKNLPLKASDGMREWNSKVHFKGRLFDLVSKHKKSIVVLSYEAGGYPSISDLIDLFKANFKNVFIFSNHISHALNNNKKEEIMILGC